MKKQMGMVERKRAISHMPDLSIPLWDTHVRLPARGMKELLILNAVDQHLLYIWALWELLVMRLHHHLVASNTSHVLVVRGHDLVGSYNEGTSGGTDVKARGQGGRLKYFSAAIEGLDRRC